MTGAAWLEKLSKHESTASEECYYRSAFENLCQQYHLKFGCWPTRLEFDHLTVPSFEVAQEKERKSA